MLPTKCPPFRALTYIRLILYKVLYTNNIDQMGPVNANLIYTYEYASNSVMIHTR